MLSGGHVRQYLLLCICFDNFIQNAAFLFYVTNIKCQVEDETFLKINSCFTKRLTNTISETTLNVTLLDDVKSAMVKLGFTKKSNNMYNSYLYDGLSIDACKFLEKRSTSPLANYLYSFVEEYTNVNHTCPIKGTILVDRLRMDMTKVKWLPMPPGDYAAKAQFYAQGKKRFALDLFFSFSE